MAAICPPQNLAKISLSNFDHTQESCAERYGGQQTTEEKEPKQIQIDNEDVNFEHGELKVGNTASFIPQKEIGVKDFGLTHEAVQHVQQCQDNFPGHESNLYYVNEMIEDYLDNYTEIADKDKVTGILERFLFTNDKAHEVSTWLSKIYLIDHESMSYWTKQYVEFWNDTLHPSPSFPHEEKLTGQWFKMPGSQLIKGISLKAGKSEKDFSHNDGFYLTADFEQAKKWSWHKCSPAVLIFECEFTEEEFLDLTTDTDKWDEIVTYCRGGENGKSPDGFKAAKSIYGKMCGVGTKKSLCKNPQLCIKNEVLAKKISQSLKGIYFFCKKDKKKKRKLECNVTGNYR